MRVMLKAESMRDIQDGTGLWWTFINRETEVNGETKCKNRLIAELPSRLVLRILNDGKKKNTSLEGFCGATIVGRSGLQLSYPKKTAVRATGIRGPSRVPGIGNKAGRQGESRSEEPHN